MHMDRVAARRTQAGMPVVHGVHTLLWALESLISGSFIVSPINRIRVKFLKWVYLGDEAHVGLPNGEATNPNLLQVEVLGMPVLSAQLRYGEASDEPRGLLMPSPATPLPRALDLSFADLDGRSGDAFTAAPEDAVALFPQLSAVIGATAVAEIAACSYIVGMEAPGLHSMFSKLDLTIAKPNAPGRVRKALHYLVTSHDERFRKACIAVTGHGISGTLDVFVRVPPVRQAPMEEVGKRVMGSEFQGMNALVIGGSRGLGELTAKLIAAGGGQVTVTYAAGKSEAVEVVEQIVRWGGKAAHIQYDIRQTPEPQLARLIYKPTHLFYFATSNIYRPKGQLIAPSTLAEFSLFYLQGFYDLCKVLIEPGKESTPGPRRLVAFYPSSVFVEDRPAGMTEYAMIKSAGEQMCRDMNQYLAGLQILVKRLPRLPTDQTAGIMPERNIDPIEVLLSVVREMQSLSRSD